MTAAFAPGSALAYLRAHRDQAVNAVATLVRIPTVSAQKEHRPHLDHCAQWLRNHLARIGLAYARLVSTPTGGPPLVMAEWTGAAGRPTVLIYGHYDVQPADAGEGEVWEDPPFAGITRGDELRGRGASDNKGQFFAHLAAIEAQLATTGRLPVNVRCLFEGEEEIGSPGLLAVTGSRPELFSADVAVISDMPMVGPDYPAITYAMRGLLSAEVTIERPGPSLHAGLFGGAVSDPIHALCRLAATLRMPDGRINLPNFYADVREVDATDRREMAQIATLGGGPRHHDVGGGEPDFTPIERTTIRPAMTVTAFQGGYMGTGIKSAIARVARLDLDLRLVPDQRSDAALAGLRKHCAALA
ncbi:MAG TPA: M20/M25/M40 family metallo-hydrolase, partial [Polyangia bacterium]|nr:M20/M25/M40 family metallo-hydrolase [Polyangia bacterium]